jgi:hypothetical protein
VKFILAEALIPPPHSRKTIGPLRESLADGRLPQKSKSNNDAFAINLLVGQPLSLVLLYFF